MALDFNGTTSYVQTAANTALNNLAVLSCAAWVNLDNMGEGNGGRLFEKGTGTTGWLLLSFNGLNTNTIRFTRYLSSGVDVIYRTAATNTITTGTWTHIAATWNGGFNPTDIKLYKDGAEVTYGEISTPGVGPAASDAATALYIGNRAANDRTLDGRMAEPGVWNVVLTAAEILSLAKGKVPEGVRPQSLLDYRPFVRTGQPLKGGANTDSNVTIAVHPRIYR